jgi:hypothetical protein
MKEKSLDPKTVSSTRRRLGFVAFLWWLAAAAGTIGLVQKLSTSWVRMLCVFIAWVFALFFSYAWWEVHKGRIPE